MDRAGLRPSVRTSALAVIGAAALFTSVSACGTTAATDGTGQAAPAATTSSSYFSPVDEYLNPSASAAPVSDEEYAAKEKQLQELVAACMTDEGFEYVPFVYPVQSVDNDLYKDAGTRGWAEKYGYGISTTDQLIGPDTQVVDPNQAIAEAMGDSEREAYYVALHGDQGAYAMPLPEPIPEPAETPAASSVETTSDPSQTSEATATSVPEPSEIAEPTMPPLEEQGCYGKAQLEVYGDTMSDPAGDGAEFQGMWDDYNKVWEGIEKDPRVTAAVTQWVDCMTGAGYPGFSAVWDANQQVNDDWAELNGYETMMYSDGDAASAASSAPPTPTSPPAAEAAAFRAEEIKIALADFDCQEASNHRAVSEQVRIELETAFVESHRAELEQYRDAINGGG